MPVNYWRFYRDHERCLSRQELLDPLQEFGAVDEYSRRRMSSRPRSALSCGYNPEASTFSARCAKPPSRTVVHNFCHGDISDAGLEGNAAVLSISEDWSTRIG